MPEPQTLLEGKYEILKKLREGGMGAIYSVRHRLLDEVRAIKVMRPHVVADADLKRRFVEEAKTATRLKHPNICTIHDFALGEDGTAYLVMEFIEGVNLADLLRSQGVPHPALSLEVAHQALLALAYLHRKGVVHRDVAPDNLMLTQDAEDRTLVKLIDLGIAKTTNDRAAADMTASGVFLGKLKYASPEQFGSLASGERLDGRSDLYGLGVVLYELLTGVRPFVGETPAELLRSHLFNPPLPFSESDPEGKIPEELRSVVMRAIERKREDRFATAEDFDREIVALKGRIRPPRDQDDTHAILARMPKVEPVLEGFTPSAQSRLDLQFLGQTPRPSRDLTLVPEAPVVDRPNVARMVAERAALQDVDETAAAPPARVAVPLSKASVASPAAPGLPPARTRRFAALPVAAAVFVVLVSAFLLTRPRDARPPAAAPAIPLPTAAPADLPAVASAPAPTAVPPQPTAEPTAEPAVPTAVRATAAPPAPPDPKARQALDAARAQAARARQAAERAKGPELAAEAYNRGRAMETDGALLIARNKTADAAGAFDLAARFYAEALATAQKPAAPPPPAAAPATHAPAQPRVEPTAAPERPAVVVPAPPPQSRPAPSESDRIREAVALYEKAQSTLDAELYARIYPSVDRARIEAAFRSFASQNVTFEIRRIDLDPSGTKAEVHGFEKRVAVPRAGSEQRINAERVMRLRKQGDGWVIQQLD